MTIALSQICQNKHTQERNTTLVCQVKSKGWSEEALCSALLTEAQVTQITREVLEGEERIAPGLPRHSVPTEPTRAPKAA